MYATASNLSPASPEYEALVAERVEALHAADPDMADVPIPADLVTCSGSGLDRLSLPKRQNIRCTALHRPAVFLRTMCAR